MGNSIFGVAYQKSKKRINSRRRTSTKNKNKTPLINYINNEYGTKKGLSLEHIKILKKCNIENTLLDLMGILKRTNRTKFRQKILNPLLKFGYLVRTEPHKIKSPKQKYRLTNKFVRAKKI